MLFSAIVIGKVSYYIMHLYLDLKKKKKKKKKKERTRSTQTLVNSGLYWIEGFSKGNIALLPFIVFLKRT